MPDLLALGQGLEALKAAADILKAMIGVRDARKLAENAVELQRQIANLQIALNSALTEQAALIQTIHDLEESSVRMKQWQREKNKYQLTEIAPHRYAYAIKENRRGAEPVHWICAACYQDSRKSVLQGFQSGMSGWIFTCSSCKAEIRTGFAVS